MQSPVRDEKESASRKIAGSKEHLRAVSHRSMGYAGAGSGVVENEFHFQDARMVFWTRR